MAKKYDPLKSNRSSYFTKPKKTWSDKRSGDSVGRGLKRGSYKAYTAYHSRPKKSAFKVTTTRRTKSTKSSTARKTCQTTSKPSTFLEWLRELSSPITLIDSAPQPTPETDNIQKLHDEYFAAVDKPRLDLGPDDSGPIYDSNKPRNTNHCPYCNFAFAKAPKRGRACENCGKKFVVRSNCVLYNSNLLTLDESHANDFFFQVASPTDTPIKFAKQALAENPNLSTTELFVKIIELYSAVAPHDYVNNAPERESWAYQALARYEESCGRSGKRFQTLSKTKEKEADKIIKDFNKRFFG